MFKIRIFLTTVLFLLLSKTTSYAFLAETFVPLVHVVDSIATDPNTTQNSLDIPKIIYEESTPSGFFNTWVLTPKAVQDSTISAFFKKISKDDSKQEIGLFLVPKNEVNLQSLRPDERKKALDVEMVNFFEVFGYFPKTISATSFDAVSLQYLQTHYSVLGAVIIPDSDASTPSKSGAYSNSPYFPSKNNFMVPAKSLKTRINLTLSETIPFQFFNTSDLSYLSQKQLNEFTQFNISTSKSSPLITRQVMTKFFFDLAKEKGKHNLNFLNYSTFADWFKARYPESTPAYFYKQNNDIGSDILYQSPWYKIILKEKENTLEFVSFYVYNHDEFETNYATPQTNSSVLNPIPNLLANQPNLIVSKSSDPLLINYLKQWDSWSISLQNQKEKITLDPNRILFKGLLSPNIVNPILKVSKEGDTTTWTPQKYLPYQGVTYKNKIFWLTLLLITIYFLFKKNKPPFLGLVLIAIASLTLVRSGQLYPFGMGFWGPNGHDAIFHLSLIQNFSDNPLSLSHPQVVGETLSNYHFFFDYISGIIVKLTSTQPIFYYFIVFPVFTGLVFLKLLILVFEKFDLSAFQKNLALVLVFLGSSLGYMVRYFQTGDLFSGESAFWANQSVSLFLNPPFLVSLVFLLSFFLVYSRKSKSKKDYILLVALGAILSQTKIYAFILLVLALFVQRRFMLAAAISFFGVLINLPFSKAVSPPFVFEPLWFIKTMLESYDRTYWPKAADAWQAYEATGQFGKLMLLNLVAFVIFFLGNLGVRVLGLYQLIAQKNNSDLQGLVKSIVILSLALPLFITQSINPWNSIQFTYYSLFLLAIFTAKFFTRFNLFAVLITIFGIFGSFGTLRDYVTENSTSRISYVELAGLSVLSNMPKGVVISPPYSGRSFLSSPQPQYDYVTSSYISGLSGQAEFLSDQINLDITGVNYQKKLKEANRFYNTTDASWAINFLKENKINYVYEVPLRKLTLNYSSIGLQPIFTSPEINIYHFAGI